MCGRAALTGRAWLPAPIAGRAALAAAAVLACRPCPPPLPPPSPPHTDRVCPVVTHAALGGGIGAPGVAASFASTHHPAGLKKKRRPFPCSSPHAPRAHPSLLHTTPPLPQIILPSWVDIVKTAPRKELAPYDADWYYVRAGE